jgi:hypothetical protein
VRGVTLDEGSLAALPGALVALRGRGRLVAPAAVSVPPDVTELARDARHWVGERQPPAGPPVRLVRAR